MILFVPFVSGVIPYAVETFGAADAFLETTLNVDFGGLCFMAVGLAWFSKCFTVKVMLAAL